MRAACRTTSIAGLIALTVAAGGSDIRAFQGQELDRWGSFLDPNGVGRAEVFESESESFLTIFSERNSTHFSRDPIGDAPRVMRSLLGAFAFQVHVSWRGATAYEWSGVRTGAGPIVIIYSGPDQYLQTALMYDTYRSGKGDPYELWTGAGISELQRRTDPSFGGARTTHIEGPGIWIRIERRGSHFRSLFGVDGKKWVVAREIEMSLPDSIELSFVVPNSTDSEMLGVFRSLEFDDAAVQAEDLVEDPYQVSLRRAKRAGYLQFAGWLGAVGGVVLVFGFAVRLITSRSLPHPRGQRFSFGAVARGYVAAFVTTMAVLAVAVLPGANASYMGDVIALGVLIVAAPFVALWTLAWLPVGSQFLLLRAEPHIRARTLMWVVGLSILVVVSPGFFLWFVLGQRSLPLIQTVAATAAGGAVYLTLLRRAS